MASKSRQSLSGGRGESVRVKEKNESPPVPDSTTEPVPIPAQRFQEGDEVFYLTDARQHILGTVAEVRGQTCLVQFGDGTEQLAPFKRLKKLFEDEEDVVQPKRKKSESTPAPPQPPRPQQTCTSCGASRRITATKAKLYESDLRQFECRSCVKISQTSRNSYMEIMSPITTNALKGKLPPDISIIPMGSPAPSFSLPSTSASNSVVKPKSPSHNSAVSISKHIQLSIVSAKKTFCFSCEQVVQPFDSVGCNFCDRPCHLFCLHLNPTPLNGDTFWHLVCSTCGNQNSNEKVEKKFGVRRNIVNWGDIAYLLISCLSVTSSHRMFDFEKEMLPFLEQNWDSLHIPRQFKSHTSEARNRFILNALQNSPHRFQNGKDFKLKVTLWGNRSHEYGIKDRISSIASQMGLKQTGKSEKKIGIRNIPALAPPQPSPDLLRFVTSTKIASPCPSPAVSMDESESDTTSRSDIAENSLDRDWKNILYGTGELSGFEQITLALQQDKKLKNNSGTHDTASSSSRRTHTSEDKRFRNRTSTIAKHRKRKHSAESSRPVDKTSFGTHSESTLPLNKRAKTERLSISSSAKDSERAVNSISHSLNLVSGFDKASNSTPTITRESSPEIEDRTADEVVPLASLFQISSKLASPPRALKSASSIPLSPHQVRNEMEKNKQKPKKERLKAPKKQLDTTTKGLENSLVVRAKRGRPSGSASRVGGTPMKSLDTGVNGRALRRNNPKQTPIVSVSRRVGTFNSISERRPIPPVIEDPSSFNLVNESLFDAALYSGYRFQCLPSSPRTEVEKRNEALKVFSHFRTEKNAEMASSLLSRSELETRSQTRRKSELFFGSQNRDLNDFDSYEVIGKRVDPNGIVRYQVIWKRLGADVFHDFDDDVLSEDETEMEVSSVEAPPFSVLNLFGKPDYSETQTTPNSFYATEEEDCIYIPLD